MLACFLILPERDTQRHAHADKVEHGRSIPPAAVALYDSRSVLRMRVRSCMAGHTLTAAYDATLTHQGRIGFEYMWSVIIE